MIHRHHLKVQGKRDPDLDQNHTLGRGQGHTPVIIGGEDHTQNLEAGHDPGAVQEVQKGQDDQEAGAVTVAVETGLVVADVIVLEVDHPCHHDEDTMETGMIRSLANV